MKKIMLCVVAMLALAAPASANYFHSGEGGDYDLERKVRRQWDDGSGYYVVVRIDRRSGRISRYDYNVVCNPYNGGSYSVVSLDNHNRTYIDPSAGVITGGRLKFHDNLWHYVCNGVPFAND